MSRISSTFAGKQCMVEIFDLYGPRAGTVVSLFECPDPDAIEYAEEGIPKNVKVYKDTFTPVTVFDYLQRPYVLPLDKVNDLTLNVSLKRILRILNQHKIEVTFKEGITAEESYRFILEDVLPAQMGISRMTNHERLNIGHILSYTMFDYDKFYPDLINKLTAKTKEILTDFLSFHVADFFNYEHKDPEDVENLKKLYNKINNFHQAYHQIDITSLSIHVNDVEGNHCNVDYDIQFIATERISGDRVYFESSGMMRYSINLMMGVQTLVGLSVPFMDDPSDFSYKR
jgi:hypothetical protein